MPKRASTPDTMSVRDDWDRRRVPAFRRASGHRVEARHPSNRLSRLVRGVLP